MLFINITKLIASGQDKLTALGFQCLVKNKSWMYLGQKDEKVHQFVLIKIKASIIIIRDRSIFHYYSNPFNCKYVKQRISSL